MHLMIYIFISLLFQEVIPFKPLTEFKIVVDYEFRNKPAIEQEPIVDWSNNKTPEYVRSSLPFAKMTIQPLKLSSDEERVRVVDNLGNRVYSRKSSLDTPIAFEMGFADDLKDHISPFKFDIIFFTKRKEVSRIHLYFNGEGDLIVNEEM